MSLEVIGARQVSQAFHELRQSVQTRITRSAQRTAMSVVAKEIKKQIPGRYKDARKAIGSSVKKGKSKLVEAKAGVGVGYKRKKRERDDEKRASKAKGKRRGVGISANNIHWMILGTKSRKQKTTGHPTGIMQPNEEVKDIVKKGWEQSRHLYGQTMQKRMTELIAREAAKAAAKVVK